MPRHKLLILTSRLPYPPIGGDRLRIYQICKHLSQSFELSLLSLCESTMEMNACIPEDGIFTKVERVFHSKSLRLLGCMRTLGSKKPFQLGYYRNSEFANRLEALVPHHDLIFAHLIRTAEYALPYAMPKILEMTDAISLSYSRAAAKGMTAGLRSLAYREEAKRLLEYERDVTEQFDLSVLVSAVDRDFLFPSGAINGVMICPNGVDTEALEFRYRPDGATIVFIGKNTAFHNANAIIYFTEAVLPLIRAKIPNATFKVIGATSDSLHKQLAQHPGVILTGAVKNLGDAVKGASVGVCPVQIGAGVQNKLLDYMALGIPAVTSPVGLEGLDALPNVHLLLAGSPGEWAQRVCTLLRNPEHGRKLACLGRALVEKNYCWASRLSPLTDAIVMDIAREGNHRSTRHDGERL